LKNLNATRRLAVRLNLAMLRRTILHQTNGFGPQINQQNNIFMKLSLRHAQVAYREKEIPV
jgi:hypothetical protein